MHPCIHYLVAFCASRIDTGGETARENGFPPTSPRMPRGLALYGTVPYVRSMYHARQSRAGLTS